MFKEQIFWYQPIDSIEVEYERSSQTCYTFISFVCRFERNPEDFLKKSWPYFQFWKRTSMKALYSFLYLII